MRSEIRQLKDMIEKLSRVTDVRIPVLAVTDSYDYSRDGSATSIATISEVQRKDQSESIKEIRRMESSFASELVNLYQRVDEQSCSTLHRTRR